MEGERLQVRPFKTKEFPHKQREGVVVSVFRFAWLHWASPSHPTPRILTLFHLISPE